GHHHRPGGAEEHCHLARGHSNRHHATYSRRRRADRGERVGARRGDHTHLCGRAHLGSAQAGAAHHVFHRATLPELDTYLGRSTGHRVLAHRLHGAGGCPPH